MLCFSHPKLKVSWPNDGEEVLRFDLASHTRPMAKRARVILNASHINLIGFHVNLSHSITKIMCNFNVLRLEMLIMSLTNVKILSNSQITTKPWPCVNCQHTNHGCLTCRSQGDDMVVVGNEAFCVFVHVQITAIVNWTKMTFSFLSISSPHTLAVKCLICG